MLMIMIMMGINDRRSPQAYLYVIKELPRYSELTANKQHIAL